MRIPPSIQWLIDRLSPPEALLMSDDAQIHAFVADAIGRSRFRLRRAYDRSQALAEVERLMPQVVVLDLGMPEAVAFKALAGLRRIHPHAGIIGLLGAQAGPQAVRAASALGIDGLLRLPVAEAAFIAMLERAARKPRR